MLSSLRTSALPRLTLSIAFAGFACGAAATAPPNDNFPGAVISQASGGVSHDSTLYSPPTLQAGEPELVDPSYPSDGAGKGSVWYTYTVPEASMVYIHVGGVSDFRRLFGVYTGDALENLEQIFVTRNPDRFFYSLLAEGTVLRIRVDGTGDDYFGGFEIHWASIAGSTMGTYQWLYTEADHFHQMVSWDFATSIPTAGPVVSRSARFNFWTGEGWVGNYLYDYATGQFVDSLYDLSLEYQAQESSSVGASKNAAAAAAQSSHLQLPFFKDQQTVHLVRSGANSTHPFQALIYNFTSAETTVTPLAQPYEGGGEYGFQLPYGEWVGIFHYDYLRGRFTEGAYRLKESL